MRALIPLVSLTVALAAGAQGPSSPPPRANTRDGDVQLRINGPVHVAVGDTAATVWVVNDDATIDGVVRDGLGVVNGNARVSGRVEGGIVVVNGHLDLVSGARVGRDIMLYRSTVTRASDALVAGQIHQESGFSFGRRGVWLLWLSFTLVVVLAGLLFAEVAPDALAASAGYLTTHGGRSLLTALIVVVAVPAIAIMSFATVIGIPLGLTLLFVVIPALSFLGYLVAGAALGSALLMRPADAPPRFHYHRTVAFGLLVLQLVGAVPVIGGLVVLIASQLGVGAMVARLWWERRRVAPTPAPAPVAS